MSPLEIAKDWRSQRVIVSQQIAHVLLDELARAVIELTGALSEACDHMTTNLTVAARLEERTEELRKLTR